ncbi:MAG: hypothetical protein HY866_01325 [Chloroflexi bacterium]|nr:hypothetical protein [Chloroflexota bacterium]
MSTRILIMSDDVEFRAVLHSALPKAEYEVFEVTSKDEAIAFCRRKALHCLVADISDPNDINEERQFHGPLSIAFYSCLVDETDDSMGVLMLFPQDCYNPSIWDGPDRWPLEYLTKPIDLEFFEDSVKYASRVCKYGHGLRLHPVSALLQGKTLDKKLKFMPNLLDRIPLELKLQQDLGDSDLVRFADLITEARHIVGTSEDVIGQLADDLLLFVTSSTNVETVKQWLNNHAAERLCPFLSIKATCLEDVFQRLGMPDK